jgi:hypothetical protein
MRRVFSSCDAEGLQSLVEGLVQEAAGDDLEPSLRGQVVEQVHKGRGITMVRDVEVLGG